MRAHEFAQHLIKFAKLLRNGPDFELDDISFPSPIFRRAERLSISKSRPSDDLPVALSALLSLSRFDKQEWISLIQDIGLPIEIRPRDASRDILGKVLRVLEDDPTSRELLNNRVRSTSTKASPELMRALGSLLGK
jgi:hypothetical protein